MAMPTIPTSAEIRARIIADIETELDKQVRTSKSWNRVIAGRFRCRCYCLIVSGNIVGIPTDISRNGRLCRLIPFGKIGQLYPVACKSRPIITADVYPAQLANRLYRHDTIQIDTGVVYLVLPAASLVRVVLLNVL